MLKKYVFHYDQSRKADETKFEGWSYHDSLAYADGKTCQSDLTKANESGEVEVYFDDGNMLAVFCYELSEAE